MVDSITQAFNNIAFCLSGSITKWHAVGAVVVAAIGFNFGYLMCLLA